MLDEIIGALVRGLLRAGVGLLHVIDWVLPFGRGSSEPRTQRRKWWRRKRRGD